MKSLRSLEGEFLIDHRESPGVPDCVVVSQGLPAGAGYGIFESAVVTCNHCETQVVLNPKRSRERGFCRKCNHYLCDVCETAKVNGAPCYPFKDRVRDILERIDQGKPHTDLILL